MLIRYRLYLINIVVLLVFAATIGFATYQAEQVKKRADSAFRSHEVAQLTAQLKEANLRESALARSFFLGEDPEQTLAQVQTIMQETQKTFAAIRTIATKNDNRELLARLDAVQPRVESFLRASLENLKNIRSYLAQADTQWLHEQWVNRHQVMGAQRQEVEQALDGIMSFVNTRFEEKKQDLHQDIDGLVMCSIVGGVVMILFLSLFVGLQSRGIYRSTKLTSESLRKIQETRNLVLRVQSLGHDEIAQLAQSINGLLDDIQSGLQAIAHVSSEMTMTSTRLLESASLSRHAIDHHQSQLVQVSSAITEMNATTQSIGHSAEEVAHFAAQASEAAAQGVRIVAQAMQDLDTLAKTLGRTGDEVQNVEAQTLAIESLLGSIRSLIEQVNLLALNAAIEAARAGEHGRGFAVVADEVRVFAGRVNQFALDIEGRLESLKSIAQNATASMKQSMQGADDTVSSMRSAEQAFGQIAEHVEGITRMTGDLANVVTQQVQATDEVARSASSITVAAEQISRTIDLVSGEAEATEKEAGRLREVVRMYKVFDDNHVDLSLEKSGHLALRSRLRSYLDGRESASFVANTDHLGCLLGHWRQSPQARSVRDKGLLEQIDRDHAKVHRMVDEVIKLKESGQIDKAEALFDELTKLSDTLVERLTRLEQEGLEDGA